jgi:hypothetical protein
MPGTTYLGVFRGAALYVGALIGPGLLLIPALGVQVAGPASIVAWGGLLRAVGTPCRHVCGAGSAVSGRRRGLGLRAGRLRRSGSGCVLAPLEVLRLVCPSPI